MHKTLGKLLRPEKKINPKENSSESKPDVKFQTEFRARGLVLATEEERRVMNGRSAGRRFRKHQIRITAADRGGSNRR